MGAVPSPPATTIPRVPADAVRWSCSPYSVEAADAIARELSVSTTLAAILVRRGYDSPATAKAFLAAADRHDPGELDGMAAACELILGHVRRGSRIVVHGDYDVDGAASTAIMVRALRSLGADPAWHLPSRFEGGYGLADTTVDRLAEQGTGLLVTVDCAITAVDEVERARARGIDVVVTDHHRPGERLPDCPILHPALGAYPFRDLCAAGVAHKLAIALARAAGEDPARADEDLDLVALATVCDVVPLRGENRRLVRDGLVALARTGKPGLRALMRVAALDPGQLDERAVGFRLGPRLNAAGRLGTADAALELLLTEDEERAAEVADELDLLNRDRRDAETRILFAAEAARAEQAHEPAYVLAGEGWHPGVIGIVASRMAERHHRPCVLVALDGDGGRGSGRSIPAFDLHAGLGACAAHLRRFGGHRAAAGLEIDAGSVDAFRAAFVAHAAGVLSVDDLRPVHAVDAVVPAGALGMPLAEELALLAPFGQGNREPTLLAPAVRIDAVRAMGGEGQHARFSLVGGAGRAAGVAFRTPPRSLAPAADEPHDAAVGLELREWMGAIEARVVLRALARIEPGRCTVLGESGSLWEAIEREWAADPADGASVPRKLAGERPAVRDVRGAGFAGVAGDLLSSGGRVLVLCADAEHRRPALERVVAGLARLPVGPDDNSGDDVAVASWEAVFSDPALVASFQHVVALDPPVAERQVDAVAAAGCRDGGGFVHLAWGHPEVEFALTVAARRARAQGIARGRVSSRSGRRQPGG